jgi:hypothetical protein
VAKTATSPTKRINDLANQNDNFNQYRTLLAVLHYVFIEIRGTDDLREAQIYADIFHNAPSAIGVGIDAVTIEQQILTRAAQQNCEPQIRSLFSSARKNASVSSRNEA